MQDWRLSKMDAGLRGTRRVVKTGGATLKRDETGAALIFAATTVTTYTLPKAEVGMYFDVWCEATAAGTADIFRIVCATGDFFVGTILQFTDGTLTVAAQDANGTTHLALELNGSTTGGLKGDKFEIACKTAGIWSISGISRATGTEATPFKTS